MLRLLCFCRSALVDALACSVSPAVVQHDPANITPDTLSDTYRKVLAEIVRYLNLEKILPCYKLTVTVSCLKAIRVLQKNGHLPPKSSIFMNYAAYPVFIDVRLSAIDQLIDFLPHDGGVTELNFLLNLAETDPMPRVRYEVLRRLALNKPFKMGEGHKLDNEPLVERLWAMMNSNNSFDSRIRGGVMDLYYALYGRRRPSCIPASSSEPVVLHTPSHPSTAVHRTPNNLHHSTPIHHHHHHSSSSHHHSSNTGSNKSHHSRPPLITPQRLHSLLPPPGHKVGFQHQPALVSLAPDDPSNIVTLTDDGTPADRHRPSPPVGCPTNITFYA